MRRKERVWKAVRHEPTDFIPYQVDFTQQEHDRVAEYLGDPEFEPDSVVTSSGPTLVDRWDPRQTVRDSSGMISAWCGTRPAWTGTSA